MVLVRINFYLCGRIKVTGSVGGVAAWPCQAVCNAALMMSCWELCRRSRTRRRRSGGRRQRERSAWPFDRCAGTRSGAHRNSLRDSWDPQAEVPPKKKCRNGRKEFFFCCYPERKTLLLAAVKEILQRPVLNNQSTQRTNTRSEYFASMVMACSR